MSEDPGFINQPEKLLTRESSKAVFNRLWKPNEAKTLLATPRDSPPSRANHRIQACISNLRSSPSVLRLSLLPSEATAPELRSGRVASKTFTSMHHITRLNREKLNVTVRHRKEDLTPRATLESGDAVPELNSVVSLDKSAADKPAPTPRSFSSLPQLSEQDDNGRPKPRRQSSNPSQQASTIPEETSESPSRSADQSQTRSRLTSDEDEAFNKSANSSKRRKPRPLRRSNTNPNMIHIPGTDSGTDVEESGGEGPGRRISAGHSSRHQKRQKNFGAANPGEKPRKPKYFLRESRFHYEGDAYELFQRCARKIFMVIQWTTVLARKDTAIENHMKSFLDIAQDLEDGTAMDHIEQETGLSFDPTYYKAKKDIQLNHELKSILTLTPDSRTPDMIQKVLLSLTSLQAFVEYPPHMQAKFAQVAWYQQVEPKHTILKQGHPAQNFYFILNGSAIVKKIFNKSGDVSVRAVARLQKGQSFGEVALLHHTQRSASVESFTAMEVLVISKEDFHRIFFNAKDGEEPEHIMFCRKNVDFLQLFPMEKCVSTPGTCVYHYFRPGAVVVGDSQKNNDWIYIVKSGHCHVIKKLKYVSPQRQNSPRQADSGNLQLPRIVELAPKVNSRLRRRSCSSENNSPSTAQRLKEYLTVKANCADDGEVKIPKELLERIRKAEGLGAVNEMEKSSVLNLSAAKIMNQSGDNAAVDQSKHDVTEVGDVSNPSKSDAIQDGKQEETGVEKKEAEETKTKEKSSEIPLQRSGIHDIKTSTKSVRFKPCPTDRSNQSTPKPNLKERRSTEGSTKGPSDSSGTSKAAKVEESKPVAKQSDPPEPKPAEVVPVPEIPCYVQLRRLRPKEAFGLEDLTFDDDKTVDTPKTSVTLVSNGAELIMMSRRFFIKHASDIVRQFVREKIRPYPNEQTLQENLQREVNWDLYRKDVVQDLILQKQDVRELLPVLTS